MWDELENALAWYASAPKRWVESAKKDVEAAAQWIWEVLQGDFNDDQTTVQMVTGTVISMIPFVDQICDVRDVVANCKKIHNDSSHLGHWVALGLTLIGLFPTLGSLAKGCGKVMFASARKGVLHAAAKGADTTAGKIGKEFIETAITKLNQHLDHPLVKKALKKLDIDNVYKWLAEEIRKVSAKVNTSEMKKAFDAAYDTLKKLTDLIEKWAPKTLGVKVKSLMNMVDGVGKQLDQMMGKALKPVQDWLDHLTRRLDIEADKNYRAYTNALNPHGFKRVTVDAELAEIKANKPAWVDIRSRAKFKEVEIDIIQKEVSDAVAKGWSNPITNAGRHPLNDSYKTFHTLKAVEIPPGTTLYRVVDPSSFDNSICWMTKAEFESLKTKDDWRRRFAVWKNWNSNGEFVTYVVPPGQPLKAWEGVTASQRLKPAENIFLEGGARQIVIDPKDLEKSFMSKRKATGWAKSDGFKEEPTFLGLPDLTNNWR